MSFHTDEWQQQGQDVARALPHALGPEKSLLSSMLQDPQDWIGVAIEEKLTSEHFYLPSHAALFSTLVERFAAGKEIEFVSLTQKLLDRGQLDNIGGPATLTDLYTYAPSAGHFRSHLAIVKEKHSLRQLLSLANHTIAGVYDSPDEADALLEEVERKIMAIREGAETEPAGTTKDAVERVLDNLKAKLDGKPDARGLMTGYEVLDRMTGGLKPGQMMVVGARPSMGKTSFMMNIVENVVFGFEVPTLVFSAEMEREEIVERLMFCRARFAASHISRGDMPTKGDLQRIQRAAIDIARSKLFIRDESGPTISQIRAIARRYKREHKIGLIAIDYLQLLKSTSKQAQSSREREVSEISAGIKGMAKDMGIPVIVLAQLNRQVETRGGKTVGKPRMSDLRDSGSIEQDADIIGLLHRSAYYAEDAEEKEALAGEAELILAKNRGGATGVIPLTFVTELMRFETGEPAREREQQPAIRSRHAN